MIDNLAVAGTELQLLKLIDGLDRSKAVPHLCLLDGASDLSRSLEPEDCPVIRLGIRSLHHPSSLMRALKFARFLRQQRIDIVQTYFPDSTYFGVFVARMARVRRVVRTRRDLGYWLRPIDRWAGWSCGRLADLTITPCEACREAIIEQESVSPESVVVIENGLDLSSLTKIPLPASTPEAAPRRVGLVANLRPVKGPDIFVRAAGLIAKRYPDVEFQMAGTGDAHSVLRLAEECGIRNRLELLGRVTNVPKFLAGLDVAVLASRSEGLSNALLEYMAAARPIVATAVGGNKELVQDDREGLLVSPESPDALAAAVARLLDNPDQARRFGIAARNRVVGNNSLEAMISKHEALYAKLLGSTPAVTARRTRLRTRVG